MELLCGYSDSEAEEHNPRPSSVDLTEDKTSNSIQSSLPQLLPNKWTSTNFDSESDEEPDVLDKSKQNSKLIQGIDRRNNNKKMNGNLSHKPNSIEQLLENVKKPDFLHIKANQSIQCTSEKQNVLGNDISSDEETQKKEMPEVEHITIPIDDAVMKVTVEPRKIKATAAARKPSSEAEKSTAKVSVST